MHIQVPFPFKGRSDRQAFSAQPPLTSSDMLNMRPYDPVTRRRRGSKREGSVKFNSSRLSNNPVRGLWQITTDGRKNTYAASSGSTDLSITTPKQQASFVGCADRQGNFYFVDGSANVSKLNVDGQVVWSFQAPIADPQHVIRAIAVDRFDNLYLGVSEGGSQATAKLWRFSVDKGSPIPVKKWEETPGAFIRRIIVNSDTVYAALNYPDRFGAYVVAYTGVLDTGLIEGWRTPVAYPINDMYLKPDGSLLGCSLPFASRGTDPRFPSYSRRTVDAKPQDILADFDRRVWAWWAADQTNNLDDSDPTLTIPDVSGKNRPLTLSVRSTSTTAPLYKTSCIAGLPAFRFRGNIGTILDEIQSQTSTSLKAAYADGSGALFPNYQGALTYVLIVARVQEDPAPTVQPLLWQNKATGSAAGYVGINIGQTNGGAAATGLGTIDDSYDATGVGMGAVGNTAYRFDYTQAGAVNTIANNTATLVISLLLDGNTNAGVDNATTAHSLVRVNGKPWDRWCSAAGATLDAGYLGYSAAVGAHFKGDIAEILVIQGYAGASQGILSHPHYPHNIHTAAVAPVANAYAVVTPLNASEMEKLEGWAGNKYGVAHLFPASAEAGGAYVAPTYGGAAPFTTTNNSGNYPHPYSLVTPTAGNVWNGPPRVNNATRSEPFVMHSPNGVAWKLDGAKGELQWVKTAGPSEDGGGIGYSIACSNDGAIIYSIGPGLLAGSVLWNGNTSAANDYTKARAWVDLGGKGSTGYTDSTVIGQKSWIATVNPLSFTGCNWTNGTTTITGTFTGYVFQSGDVVRVTAGTGVTVANYSIASGTTSALVLQAGNGTTTSTSADINGGGGNIADNSVAITILQNWASTDLKIDVDDHDNLHIPMQFPSLQACVRLYAREPDGSGASNVGRALVTYDDASHAPAFCVVCPPSPQYRYGASYDFDRAPTTTLARYARSEYDWLCVGQTGALPNSTPGVLKVRLVTATPTNGPAREQTLVQVVNGVVRKFTASTMAAFAGASTLAEPQLSTASDYIDAAVMFGKLYMTDGKGYVVVDPINDAVLQFKSSTGGKIPERCKLMVNWRGRMVLARGVDDPQNWHMSAQGTPSNWDRFPRPTTSTRAVSGNDSRVGLAPDVINCLIPYTDDMLIIGCDHSIWAIIGDPTDEGRPGGMRQISATTGIAFGRPWTLDPEGTLYFYGSRGGVWRWTPGSDPVSITLNTIDETLKDVNLSTYRVLLEWDTDFDLLRVYFVPIDGAESGTIHWVWDRTSYATGQGGGGWFPDDRPWSVTSTLVIDGDDPNDRVLVEGCGDGYIRRADATAESDDGTAFTARALAGPLTPQDAKGSYRFREFRAELASDQDGCTVNVYSSETPDAKGTVRLSDSIQPGRNRARPLSANAPYVWVETTLTSATKRYSVEAMTLEAYPTGRAHAR